MVGVGAGFGLGHCGWGWGWIWAGALWLGLGLDLGWIQAEGLLASVRPLMFATLTTLPNVAMTSLPP